MRKTCQETSISLLKFMYQTSDIVSFHKETQKLAVSTANCQLIIFDLITACKYKTFIGHRSIIQGVQFSITGKFLASFSLYDSELFIWRIYNNGFFGNLTLMIGMTENYFKKFKLPQLNNYYGNQRVKLIWSQDDKRLEVLVNETCIWIQVIDLD